MDSKPEFIAHRINLWDQFKQKQEEENKNREVKKIKITLPDGKVVEGESHKTSPLDVAGGISKRLRENTIVAKVNGKLRDAVLPLEEDCSLELFTLESPEGRAVFSHSSAHILGQAMELKFGCNLCVGPALDKGVDHFFYEARLADGKTISSDEFDGLNQLAENIINQKQPFERLLISKEDALKLMKFNPYKCDILTSKVPEGSLCTIYRCGDLIDPCSGPHVPNTNYIKALNVTKVSSSYWKADSNNDVLQRLYGISFKTPKELNLYREKLRKAEERDHRKLGTAQELFFFHEFSPGSCFFLPHGTRVYNKLQDFFRNEYWKRGFTEVVSPNMFNSKLWEQSGHWQNYKEHMFSFELDKQVFALKPMNCPGHCLMYGHRTRSYRELPLRYADFGALHRNEESGALTGLTRVRRFQQDDAHIFCTHEQIKEEMKGALDFLQHVYGIFGFTFDLELSTRPTNFLGEVEVWNKAEKQLQEVLEEFGKPWKLNPGDGAFYGPKIDIHVKDALERTHQCATIQLDFQLPIQFKMDYQKGDGTLGTPVIIHRAICGSLERMMAILIEHSAGKWPFWLSPRQAIVVPVSEKNNEYAEKVKQAIHDAKFFVDVELSDKNLNKKIREAQLNQYNFILVVGEKEQVQGTVNVRTRDNVVHGERTIEQLIGEFKELVANPKFEPEVEHAAPKEGNKGKKQQQPQKKPQKKPQGAPKGKEAQGAPQVQESSQPKPAEEVQQVESSSSAMKELYLNARNNTD